jgi:hypothetical protein
MKRCALVFALAAAILVLPSTSAVAGAPIREFLPAEDLLIEGSCDFPILAEVLVNEEHTITFFDSEGNPTTQIVQGRLVVRLTNTETGESIVRNISGPGTFTFTEDVTTLMASGAWFFFFAPGELGEGQEGAAFISHGLAVLELSETGVEIVQLTGTQEDLCVTLG